MPIEEIYLATYKFTSIFRETERILLERLSSRRNPVVVVGTFDAPQKDIADKVNGSERYFLKKTMEETGVYLILYDMKHSTYTFWGSSACKVCDAMNQIRNRIITYVVHVPSNGAKQKHVHSPEPVAREPVAREPVAREPVAREPVARTRARDSFKAERDTLASSPPPREEEMKPIQRTSSAPRREEKANVVHETLSPFDWKYLSTLRKVENEAYITDMLCQMDNGKIGKNECLHKCEVYMAELLKKTLAEQQKKFFPRPDSNNL